MPNVQVHHQRISDLEDYIHSDIHKDQGEAVALALCEVARQIARIADRYEEDSDHYSTE